MCSSRRYIIKTKVFESGNEQNYLERAITISKIKAVNSTTKALLPHRSESIIYLEGKKYSTRTQYTAKSRELQIKMVSPEKQWNGQRAVTVPKGNGNVCYYQSVIECAKVTGFINMAIDKEMGSMNFYMIWEGFPYFHEHFINIPSVPFSRSSLSYDGKNRSGLYRFTLEAAGQSQFYFLDKNLKLVKHIWSSQGFLREIR